MKIAVKGMEYDRFEDSNYTVPQCPECGMPLFSLTYQKVGKTIVCSGCGEKVFIPDIDWVWKYLRENGHHKETEQKCFKCGKPMKVQQSMINGKWRNMGGHCECGARFIV